MPLVTTSNDLIIGSFNLIAVYSPDDVPQDRDIHVGLNALNEILTSFASSGQFIPFRKKVTFPLNAGQQSYIISDSVPADLVMSPMVELSECNINFNDVIYPCLVVPYSNIVNNARVSNLQSIPSTVYLQKYPNYSELFFYPSSTGLISLTATIYGKFYLSVVDRFQELVDIPAYYIRFLKYELGRNLADIYPSANWTERTESTYQRLYKQISSVNDIDMSIQGDALLRRRGDVYQGLLGLLPVASSNP